MFLNRIRKKIWGSEGGSGAVNGGDSSNAERSKSPTPSKSSIATTPITNMNNLDKDKKYDPISPSSSIGDLSSSFNQQPMNNTPATSTNVVGGSSNKSKGTKVERRASGASRFLRSLRNHAQKELQINKEESCKKGVQKEQVNFIALKDLSEEAGLNTSYDYYDGDRTHTLSPSGRKHSPGYNSTNKDLRVSRSQSFQEKRLLVVTNKSFVSEDCPPTSTANGNCNTRPPTTPLSSSSSSANHPPRVKVVKHSRAQSFLCSSTNSPLAQKGSISALGLPHIPLLSSKQHHTYQNLRHDAKVNGNCNDSGLYSVPKGSSATVAMIVAPIPTTKRCETIYENLEVIRLQHQNKNNSSISMNVVGELIANKNAVVLEASTISPKTSSQIHNGDGKERTEGESVKQLSALSSSSNRKLRRSISEVPPERLLHSKTASPHPQTHLYGTLGSQQHKKKLLLDDNKAIYSVIGGSGLSIWNSEDDSRSTPRPNTSSSSFSPSQINNCSSSNNTLLLQKAGSVQALHSSSQRGIYSTPNCGTPVPSSGGNNYYPSYSTLPRTPGSSSSKHNHQSPRGGGGGGGGGDKLTTGVACVLNLPRSKGKDAGSSSSSSSLSTARSTPNLGTFTGVKTQPISPLSQQYPIYRQPPIYSVPVNSYSSLGRLNSRQRSPGHSPLKAQGLPSFQQQQQTQQQQLLCLSQSLRGSRSTENVKLLEQTCSLGGALERKVSSSSSSGSGSGCSTCTLEPLTNSLEGERSEGSVICGESGGVPSSTVTPTPSSVSTMSNGRGATGGSSSSWLKDNNSPAPAVPVRDSASLKNIRYGGGHEKYPSWPIPAGSVAEVDPIGSAPISSDKEPEGSLGNNSSSDSGPGGNNNGRSKSWTEQTDYPKEKVPSYARPYMMKKGNPAAYTQQLKTVMEKGESASSGGGLGGKQSRPGYAHHPQFLRQGDGSSAMASECIPERDKDHVKPLTQEDVEMYSKKYEEMIQQQQQQTHHQRHHHQYAHSEGYHSYLSSECSSSSYSSSSGSGTTTGAPGTTPFLDLLRRESGELNKQYWSSSSSDVLSDPLLFSISKLAPSGRESVTTVVTNSSSGSGGSSGGGSDTLKCYGLSSSDISLVSNNSSGMVRNSSGAMASWTGDQQATIAHSAKVSLPQKFVQTSSNNSSPPSSTKWGQQTHPHLTSDMSAREINLKKFPLSTYTRPTTLQINGSNSNKGLSQPEKLAKSLPNVAAAVAATTPTNNKSHVISLTNNESNTADDATTTTSSPIIDTSKPPSVAERIWELEKKQASGLAQTKSSSANNVHPTTKLLSASNSNITNNSATTDKPTPTTANSNANNNSSNSSNVSSSSTKVIGGETTLPLTSSLIQSIKATSSTSNIEPTAEPTAPCTTAYKNLWNPPATNPTAPSTSDPPPLVDESPTSPSPWPSMSHQPISYSYLDPEKKHKVADMTLKAIQKKALLSYYERHANAAAAAAQYTKKETISSQSSVNGSLNSLVNDATKKMVMINTDQGRDSDEMRDESNSSDGLSPSSSTSSTGERMTHPPHLAGRDASWKCGGGGIGGAHVARSNSSLHGSASSLPLSSSSDPSVAASLIPPERPPKKPHLRQQFNYNNPQGEEGDNNCPPPPLPRAPVRPPLPSPSSSNGGPPPPVPLKPSSSSGSSTNVALGPRSPSPELPPPPPPIVEEEVEVLNNDDPLPPPPNLNEVTNCLAGNRSRPPGSTTSSYLHKDSYMAQRKESRTLGYEGRYRRTLSPSGLGNNNNNKSSSEADTSTSSHGGDGGSMVNHESHNGSSSPMAVGGKVDTSLTPSAWEKYHNIRPPSTTVIFTSQELPPKSPGSGEEEELEGPLSSPTSPTASSFQRSISCESSLFSSTATTVKGSGAGGLFPQSTIPPPVAQVAPLRDPYYHHPHHQNHQPHPHQFHHHPHQLHHYNSSAELEKSSAVVEPFHQSSSSASSSSSTSASSLLNHKSVDPCSPSHVEPSSLSRPPSFNSVSASSLGSIRTYNVNSSDASLHAGRLHSALKSECQLQQPKVPNSTAGIQPSIATVVTTTKGTSLPSVMVSPLQYNQVNEEEPQVDLKKSEFNLRVNWTLDVASQTDNASLANQPGEKKEGSSIKKKGSHHHHHNFHSKNSSASSSGTTPSSSCASSRSSSTAASSCSSSFDDTPSNNNSNNKKCGSYTGRQKTQEELDCEELSRHFIKRLPQGDKLQHILVPSPEHKTTADYMEGLFQLELKLTKAEKETNTSPRSSPDLIQSLPKGGEKNPQTPSPTPSEKEKKMTNQPRHLHLNNFHHTTSHHKHYNGFGVNPEVEGQEEKVVPQQEVEGQERKDNKNAESSAEAEDSNKKRCNGHAPLPADSAYFTTSECKAKFLTQYVKDMSKNNCSPSLNKSQDSQELNQQKDMLVSRISRKLEILRTEQLEIREEISSNEQLGQQVIERVKISAKRNEFDKFKLHVEEIEKITSLLLGLSGRLARAENALMSLSENSILQEKKILESKRDKLREQLDEAKILKENIDRRSLQVSTFLRTYLTVEDYADYLHFVKMKAKLIIDAREIDEKIKLGEEQMLALQDTSTTSFNNNSSSSPSSVATSNPNSLSSSSSPPSATTATQNNAPS